MRRTKAAEALAAATVSGALYFRTLAPGVSSGDGGELLLAAQSLGIPHPPGYPLWTLLAHVAAALPLGTLAWRVNALSAVLAAIACGLFYLLARRFDAGRLGAAVATALFATSLPLWRAAVEAEVYTLAAVAFLVMVHAAFAAKIAAVGDRPRREALFFFVAGLSFLAHQTLAIPALVLGAWVMGRSITVARAGRAAAFVIAGLSPALIVPIRAASGAALLWKERTPWQAFADVFTRQAYGAMAQNPWRLDIVAHDLALMGRGLAEGAGIAAIVLAVVAIVAARRRGAASAALARLAAPAWAAFAIPVALAALLVFTPDAEHASQVAPFLLPAVAVIALAAGIGATWLAARFPEARIGAVAAAVVVLVAAALHFPACDRRGFDLPERYGRDLLASLPRGATLVVDGDNETFLAAYLTRHEGMRPDLTIIHRRSCLFGDANRLVGHPRAEWEARAHAADLARLAEPGGAVYFADPPADLIAAGVTFRIEGLVSRALAPGLRAAAGKGGPRGTAWTPGAGWPHAAALLRGHPERFDYVTRKIAIAYSDAAARAALARGDMAGAATWYEEAVQVGYDMPEAHWNLAVAAAASGDPDRALDALLTARSLAPTRAESASRLALFLVSAGRFADAARWFERAYRNAPSTNLAADAAHAWSQAGDDARAGLWRDRASTGRVG